MGQKEGWWWKKREEKKAHCQVAIGGEKEETEMVGSLDVGHSDKDCKVRHNRQQGGQRDRDSERKEVQRDKNHEKKEWKRKPEKRQRQSVRILLSQSQPLAVCSLLLPHSLSPLQSHSRQCCCGVSKPLLSALSAHLHSLSPSLPRCCYPDSSPTKFVKNNVELSLTALLDS